MAVTSWKLIAVFGVLATVGVLGQDWRGLSATFNDGTRPSATPLQMAALRQQRLNQPITRSQQFFRNSPALQNTRQTMLNPQRRQSGASLRDISRQRRLQINNAQQTPRNMQLLSQPTFRQQQVSRQQALQQRKQQQEWLQRQRLQRENSVGTSSTRRIVPQEQRFTNFRGANRLSTQEQGQRQRPLLVSGSDNSRRGGVILRRYPFRHGPTSQDQLHRLELLNNRNRSPEEVRNWPRRLEHVTELEEQQRQLYHRRLQGQTLQHQENQRAREAGTTRHQMLLNPNGGENRPQQQDQPFSPTTSLENFQKLAAENEKELLLAKREKIFNLVKLLGFQPTDLLSIVAALEAYTSSQAAPLEQTSKGSFTNGSLLSDMATQIPPVTAQMIDLTKEPKVIPNELIPGANEPIEAYKTQLAASEPKLGTSPVTHFNTEPALPTNELVNGTYNLTYATNALLSNNAVHNSALVTNNSVDSTSNLAYTTSDPPRATIQPYQTNNEMNQITNQPTSFTTQLMNVTTEPSSAASEQNNARHAQIPGASEVKSVQAPSNRFDVSIILGMKNADTTAAPINILTEAVGILEVWNGSFPAVTIPEAANDTLWFGFSSEVIANSTVDVEPFQPLENKTKTDGVIVPSSVTYRLGNTTDGFGTLDARTGSGDVTRSDVQNVYTGILENATKNATATMNSINATINSINAGPLKDDILMTAGKMLIMELLGLSESTAKTNSLVSDPALIHNITRIIASLTARIPVYTLNNDTQAAVDSTPVNVNITPANDVNISSMIRRLGLENDQSKVRDAVVNNVQLAESLPPMETHRLQQNPEMTSAATVANYTDAIAVHSFPESNNNFTFNGSESYYPYSELPQTEVHGANENLAMATAIARMYGIPIEEAMIMLNIPEVFASGEPNKNTTAFASNDTTSVQDGTLSVPATYVHINAFYDPSHDTTSSPDAGLLQRASTIMYLSRDAAQVTTPSYQAYGGESASSTLASSNSSQEAYNSLQTSSLNLTRMSQDNSPAHGSSDANVVLVWKSAASNTNTLPSLTEVHNDTMSSDNLLEANRPNPYSFDSSLAKDGFLASPGAFSTFNAPQTLMDKSLQLQTENTRIKLGTQSLLTSFSRLANDISSNVIKPQLGTGASGDLSWAANDTSLNPPALVVNSSDASATSNTPTQQRYITTTTLYSFN